MTTPDPSAITPAAQGGIRRRALLIAGGVAGATVTGLLLGAGLAPLLAGGFAAPAVAAWAAGLGGNALAGWLDTWASRQNALATGQDPDPELALLTRISTDLSQAMAQDQAIAADCQRLLAQTDAVAVALGALQGRADQQLALIRLLLGDVQANRVENNQLHNATYNAVAALQQASAQRDARLAQMLQAILDQGQRPAAPAPEVDAPIEIAGKAGEIIGYELDLAPGAAPPPPGGTVAMGINVKQGAEVTRIVGKKVTVGGPQAAPAAPLDAGPQVAIAGHQQLLATHRATLAHYLHQQALAGAAHARPEVVSGIGAARAGIAQAKAALSALGAPAEDLPGDAA